jgi:hypothetical protein
VWILFKRTRMSLIVLTSLLTLQMVAVIIIIVWYIPYLNIDGYCIAHLTTRFFLISGLVSYLMRTRVLTDIFLNPLFTQPVCHEFPDSRLGIYHISMSEGKENRMESTCSSRTFGDRWDNCLVGHILYVHFCPSGHARCREV